MREHTKVYLKAEEQRCCSFFAAEDPGRRFLRYSVSLRHYFEDTFRGTGKKASLLSLALKGQPFGNGLRNQYKRWHMDGHSVLREPTHGAALTKSVLTARAQLFCAFMRFSRRWSAIKRVAVFPGCGGSKTSKTLNCIGIHRYSGLR